MKNLDYLTSVVRVFVDIGCSSMLLYEVRTYADGWVESFFDGGLNLSYHFDSKEPA